MNELVIVGSELYEEARGDFLFFFFLLFSNSVMAFLMMMMMRLRYVPLGIHFPSSRVC